MSFEEAQELCKVRVMLPDDFTCIELVVGAPGI